MIKQLLLSILLIHATLAAGKGGGKINGPPTKKWLTLNGVEPVVVARGGFSGVAPDSSQGAFTLAQVSSLPSTILLCDLCDIFPSLAVIQSVFSRTYLFDHQYAIGTPFDVKQMQNSTRLWINVQHPTFYDRRKLSPALYIEDTMQDLKPAYISSPEIGFLKALGQKVDPAATKLVLRLMGIDEVEPTTKEKYGSLLQKLPMIKTFASGIIVPKEFIWPVDDARILQPASNLVSDAHKAGLEVFAVFNLDLKLPSDCSMLSSKSKAITNSRLDGSFDHIS